MIREAKGTGATVNEAQENAVAALGADLEADIQFEIISFPKKKVLGIFGGSEAVVRAYIEIPDQKPKKEKKPQNKKKETAKPIEKKTTEQPKKEADQTPSLNKDFEDVIDASLIPADSQAGVAIAYITNILEKLGCKNITAKASVKENSAFITLDGEDLGVVIGRRGETLDSLQYLASLAANNGNGYYKVSLNIGNYREKREQTLISLAKRVSEQVISTGKSRRLEPMNPYERRIIHTAVQSIEGVSSHSIGEGSGRRVVISSENGEGPRDNRRGHRRDKKPSNTVSSVPTREPKRDTDIPLYGKIN